MHVVYASLPFARKLALLRTLVRQSHSSVELVTRPYLKELVYLVAFEEETPEVPRDTQEVIVVAAG
jgi:predicted transposase YdaD